MEFGGLIVEKFVKYLNLGSLYSNDMLLPLEFCEKYGTSIPQRFNLKFRNGYELQVSFTLENRKLTGLSPIYEDFDFDGGEMLVFDYCKGSGFNVYIIGTDFAEIEYPSIVHRSQKVRPRKVSVHNGGLRFVKFVTEKDNMLDVVDPPASFIRRMPLLMPVYNRYVFSNGTQFEGTYSRVDKNFSGLRRMSQMLGTADLAQFNMLLFHFNEAGVVTISAFEDNFMERIFPGTPFTPVTNYRSPNVHKAFNITVQSFHMNKYCYGVDISSEYKDLWFEWGKTDYISVYSGNRAWKLQIKHRSKWERTTIHEGWLQFRDDMELQIGDTCVFECLFKSYHHFSVRVIRNED